MINRKKGFIALALLAVVGGANAITVTPITGGTVGFGGGIGAASGNFAATFLADYSLVDTLLSTITSSQNAWQAHVRSAVYVRTSGPNAGQLAFLYQVENLTGFTPPDNLTGFTISRFTNFTTAVGTITDAANLGGTGFVAPTDTGMYDVTRSLIGTLNVKFTNVAPPDTGLAPGSATEALLVVTNATSYTRGLASLQNFGVGEGTLLAPVPEPFTMALGGAAAAAFIRKRRQAKKA